jgi:hypothetical protein
VKIRNFSSCYLRFEITRLNEKFDKITTLFYSNSQTYQDFMANKNKAAISVDGADLDDINTAVKNTAPTEVPHGFYSLYYLSIKYLVVKAPKNCADVYMISFLISAGASGLEAEAIKKKSRKDLDKERR